MGTCEGVIRGSLYECSFRVNVWGISKFIPNEADLSITSYSHLHISNLIFTAYFIVSFLPFSSSLNPVTISSSSSKSFNSVQGPD